MAYMAKLQLTSINAQIIKVTCIKASKITDKGVLILWLVRCYHQHHLLLFLIQSHHYSLSKLLVVTEKKKKKMREESLKVFH